MQIFFSTVVRNTPPKQGGEVVSLDWDRKAVLARIPIYASNPEIDDPNPRGNTRGGRGIEIFDNTVVVASYHTLRIYDRELHHQRDISHPWMVNIHETYSNSSGRIWVSATAIDTAFEVDLQSGEAIRHFWPREQAGFQSALNLTPLPIEKSADNRSLFLSRKYVQHPSHLHFNAIASWQGDMYALFHAPGVIANLDREEVVIEDPALRGGHNLLIKEDGTAIVNDTYGRTVRFYNLGTKSFLKAIDLQDFDFVRALVRWHSLTYQVKKPTSIMLRRIASYVAPRRTRRGGAGTSMTEAKNFWMGHSRARTLLANLTWPPRPLFVRGLDRLGDLLFVGVSPATILCIDERQGKLVDAYSYSRNVGMCIHGLRVVGD